MRKRSNLKDFKNLRDVYSHTVDMGKSEYELARESRLIHDLSDGEYLLRRVESWAISLRKELLNIIATDSAFEDSLKEIGDNFETNLREYERKLFGLTITYEKPALIIRVPVILPHRRTRPDVLYDDTLLAYLEAFSRERDEEFEEFQKSINENAVVIFRHSYKNKAMIRDNDNIESKRIVDLLVITGYLKKDTGDYLSKYLSAESMDTGTDYTTIYVFPKYEAKDCMEKYNLW